MTGTDRVLFPFNPSSVTGVTGQRCPAGNFTLDAMTVAAIAKVLSHRGVLALNAHTTAFFQLSDHLWTHRFARLSRFDYFKDNTISETIRNEKKFIVKTVKWLQNV